ncbi:MAG: hypothetical protein IT317_17205 [Anaerolineales bacterium]|nr:hypothetical protein [Anaerolineales bacterium]
MTTTLATLRARVAARLVDAGSAVFSTATLDEALRSALAEYSAARPATAEVVLTLPGAGREVALDALDDLGAVLEVWWPYDSLAPEAWPPPRATGWRLAWDDARPVLVLSALGGAQPQAGDELRLWYTRPHTLQDLDGAAVTSVPAAHTSGLVTGAAGYAAASQHINQAGSVRLDAHESGDLSAWAAARLTAFRAWLGTLAGGSAPAGEPFGAGWPLDKWEGR